MTNDEYEYNRADFSKFLAGASEVGKADAIKVPVVDVKNIRTRLNMSQAEFAAQFWMTVHSIRNWEQGKREPDPGTRAYLTVIKNDPVAVLDALRAEVLQNCDTDNPTADESNVVDLAKQKALGDDLDTIVEYDTLAAKSGDEQQERVSQSQPTKVCDIRTNLGDVILLCDTETITLHIFLEQAAKSIKFGKDTFELSHKNDTTRYDIMGLDLGDLSSVFAAQGTEWLTAEVEIC